MAEEIKAHITGVVFQVSARTGDAVAAGDPVVVLESMKMEIPVLCENGGTVTEVRVQPGDVVQEGDVLVVVT